MAGVGRSIVALWIVEKYTQCIAAARPLYCDLSLCSSRICIYLLIDVDANFLGISKADVYGITTAFQCGIDSQINVLPSAMTIK